MFSIRTISITIVLFLTVNLKSQDLQINEVVSKNYNGLLSYENKTEDWIEVFNNSEDTLELQDYFLSDQLSNLTLWRFPNIKLAPDSFLVVFASKKDIIVPEIHTNFKLASEGEILFLSTNVIVDSVSIPKLKADYSYGRLDENSSIWKVLDVSSPNQINKNSNSLEFSKRSGFYSREFYLKVNSLRKNHSIYYTLNGSDPNENSLVFEDSVLIEDRSYLENSISNIKTTPDEAVYHHNWQEAEPNIEKVSTIKFISFYNNKPSSKVWTLNYLINTQKTNLKTICIAVDSLDLFSSSDGIYIPGNSFVNSQPNATGNYFSNKKVKAHFNLFDKKGNEFLAENCLVRIYGNSTRASAQKSIKFFAKKNYGVDKFRGPIIENYFLEYNSFILRNTQGSSLKSIISDDLAMEIVKNLDLDYSKTEFCQVFINGSYWGIQSLRNQLNDDFLEETYGLKSEDINIIDVNYETIQGDNSSFKEMITFIEKNDLSLQTNYEKVAEELDISSYIDYQIAEMFMSNFDWPGVNAQLWKSNEKDSKWRFLFYDLDGAFIEVDKNILEYCTAENSNDWRNGSKFTFLLRELLKNSFFKKRFIDRFLVLLDSEFSSETTLLSLNRKIMEVNLDFEKNFDRWHYPIEHSGWVYNLESSLVYFLAKRPCVMKKHLKEFFQLEEYEFDCENEYRKILDFKLAPNPNNGDFRIFINSDNATPILKYEVYDINGLHLIQNKVILQQDDSYHINLKNLSKGIYFIKITGTNKYYGMEKLIINN